MSDECIIIIIFIHMSIYAVLRVVGSYSYSVGIVEWKQEATADRVAEVTR